MKTLSELQKNGFEGCDVDLETSLFEYGLVCKKTEEGIQCWYGVSYGVKDEGFTDFALGWITEKDIMEAVNKDWFNKKSFFSYIGTTEKSWLICDNYTSKISDLLSYYGYENIFGTCYNLTKIENV